MLFGAAPGFRPPLPPALFVDLPHKAEGPEGAFGTHGGEGDEGPAFFLNMSAGGSGASLAIILPLDDDLPGRIEAVQRFWHRLKARPVPRDTRMTRHQRQRFRLMMRAADGRADGASCREIGIAIYGERRVSAEPWKTSPLRAAVIALVQNAAALIDGGYLRLLRHRRKP